MAPGVLAVLWLIILSVAILATIFGIRYLKNKENMAMIDRGINPKNELPQRSRPRPFTSLRIGLPLAGAGIGLFISSIIQLNVFPYRDIPGVFFGLIASLAGIGFIICYRIEMKWWKEQEAKENMD